jgi:hypothetical protein
VVATRGGIAWSWIVDATPIAQRMNLRRSETGSSRSRLTIHAPTLPATNSRLLGARPRPRIAARSCFAHFGGLRQKLNGLESAHDTATGLEGPRQRGPKAIKRRDEAKLETFAFFPVAMCFRTPLLMYITAHGTRFGR